MDSLPAGVIWGIVLGYLCGSFPTAFLVGRLNGVDLRKVGSGNLGATNVFRTLGWKWGLFVYIVDFLKGFLPTYFLPLALGFSAGWPWGVAVALAAMAGHVKPIFLLWKGGGKGIATGSGVFMALAPQATLLALAVFILIVSVTRYVSAGSLAGALCLTLVLWWQNHGDPAPMVVVGALVTVFVFWTHRANVKRLIHGEEHRIGRHPRSEETI